MPHSITTKQRIVESAIRLFNENGPAYVRLQHVADEAGMSVGNLAYHFKNKAAIVTAVYDQLFDELAEILTHYMQEPSLSDFEVQLDHYYAFFTRYKFYLADLYEMERTSPDLLARWHVIISKIQLQLRKRLDYYIQCRILTPEPQSGQYDLLTENLLMTITFWCPQQLLKGRKCDCKTFKTAVWAQIRPYLTANGRQVQQFA